MSDEYTGLKMCCIRDMIWKSHRTYHPAVVAASQTILSDCQISKMLRGWTL